MIDSGEIGEPLSIRFKLTNGYGGKGDFAHEKSETWDRRMEIDMSGGGAVTFDHGYHIYTLARLFMGEVESVFAYIGRKKDRSGYIWDSPAMISWRYKGADRFGVWEQVWGDDLLIKTNYYAGEDRMEITGSSGIIWITKCTAEFWDVPPLILYRDGKITSFNDLETDWQASFNAATRNFIDSILGKAKPELSFAEGHEVQRIAIAVKKSSDEKKIISLDEFR
jgi:predicted dehydrogenase